MSSASLWNVRWNDAQWSRTAIAPQLLAERLAQPAPRPVGQRLVEGLDVVQARRQQERHRAGEQKVTSRLAGLLADPVPFLVLDELAPARRHPAPCARVDHHQSRVAELAREAPAAVADLPALGVHPRREQLGGVDGGAYRVVQTALGEVTGRQVAEVLEHPVGHQAGADVIVEPRLGVHLVEPALRDTPLGVDLVVIEDHRHRHRREQPADRRLRPRLGVGQRVFAEVAQLVVWDVGRALSRREDLLQRRRGLIGIDLVAEHQQHVRAGAAAAGARDTQRVRAQRVDALARVVLACAQHIGGSSGRMIPADRQDVPARARVEQSILLAGKRRSRLRPHKLPVEAELVRGGPLLRHPLDGDPQSQGRSESRWAAELTGSTAIGSYAGALCELSPSARPSSALPVTRPARAPARGAEPLNDALTLRASRSWLNRRDAGAGIRAEHCFVGSGGG